MLISCAWLGRHVDLRGVDLEALGHRFTLNVAELDGIHRTGEGLRDVRVGRVLDVSPIEGARVRLTRVDLGEGEPRPIVCGAPNVVAGQTVAVALPGAVIGGEVLREAEVRGTRSQGMILSERELGLSDAHEGILVLHLDAPPGTRLADLCALQDTVFEIDNKSLTHRPDLWGHRGIAREIAALLGRPLGPVSWKVDYTEARPFRVGVEDPVRCPRYTAVTLDGVRTRSAPLWMQVLLHRIGTRPHNLVVDLTNFVMLDLGNPLHAFDRRQLQGGEIRVRTARPDERFTTLDGVEHRLDPTDLLIADAERGVALAGVMGGENSEIVADTTAIVLESASFGASGVRLTAQRHGLRTESSARFEKGLDPRLAEEASRAFCGMLCELEPTARVTSALMDVAAPAPAPTVIALRVSRVEAALGAALGAERIAGYLEALAFKVERLGDLLRVEVPSFRATHDIRLEVDLIEEVGRSYGYDHILPASPRVSIARPYPNREKRFIGAVKRYLTQPAGYDEVMTYSFGFDPFLERIGAIAKDRVRLRNPISAEMPALRTDLAPSLLQVLEKNVRREERVRIFEVGRVFHPRDPDLPLQPTTLGVLLAEPVADPTQPALFLALKGVLEGLARAVERASLAVVQGGVPHPWAHPVRQARLCLGDQSLGWLAEAHPRLGPMLDAKASIGLLELDLDAWLAAAPEPLAYHPLPRFPAVFRDFAVVVGLEVPAAEVSRALWDAGPELVREVAFRSVYSGAGIAEGKKSLAWSVTLRREDRTLADPEVRAYETAAWQDLAARVGGAPRA
jgi:phenylalanyl-tRNA synthetase beta chain